MLKTCQGKCSEKTAELNAQKHVKVNALKKTAEVIGHKHVKGKCSGSKLLR
jgi:hypothetical protein